MCSGFGTTHQIAQIRIIMCSAERHHHDARHPADSHTKKKTCRISPTGFSFTNSISPRLSLALSSRLRLLLTAYRRLLVMLSLTYLSEYTRTSAGTLETTQSTVKGLIFFKSDFRHLLSLLPYDKLMKPRISISNKAYITLIFAPRQRKIQIRLLIPCEKHCSPCFST